MCYCGENTGTFHEFLRKMPPSPLLLGLKYLLWWLKGRVCFRDRLIDREEGLYALFVIKRKLRRILVLGRDREILLVRILCLTMKIATE